MHQLWKFIHEHSKTFWGAFTTGGISVGSVVFAKIPVLDIFWVAVLLKLMITLVSAAASGFLYTLGVHYYNTKWKHRFFKHKKKDNDEEKAA